MLITIQQLDKLAAAQADFLAQGMLNGSILNGYARTQGLSFVPCTWIVAHSFSLGMPSERETADATDGANDKTHTQTWPPATTNDPLWAVESDVRLVSVPHKYQLWSQAQMWSDFDI